MATRYELRGSIAVVTLDNPPVNGLGLALRQGLADALSRAEADAAVRAVVLVGADRGFSAGADIRELGSVKTRAEPTLATVIAALEAARKPVVAAVHGVAMGGGLELALACHYRVAAPGTQVALPEVKLGLLPGAGGTQRLPRVLGAERALEMTVGGEPVKSEVLAQLPGQRLFDRLVEGELLTAAVAFAEEVAERRPLPRVRDLQVQHPDPHAFLEAARERVGKTSKQLPAPRACVEAVGAALTQPFEEGLAFERACFLRLMDSPESRALRHAFFAERAASRIPDVPEDTPLREVKRVAVVGAGTMGSGISMSFLNAGLPVTLLETKPEALERGVATVRKSYEAQVQKGKLTQDAYERRMALLIPTLDDAALRDSDLIIEAVFEELGVKEQVFRRLDAVAKPGAILATNTSTLDVNRIAAFTGRPQDVLGMHFFSPAHVMKLLEVVRGERTAKEVLATVMALARRLKKTAVIAGVCDGFIGNRMLEQYTRQAGFLLDEGATPAQVDGALERWGMAMGPFRMGDLAGNDISWAIRKRRYVERPQRRYSKAPDRLCELGRFGQKTGAGWYDYAPGKRDALRSPVVEELLVRHREALGRAPRSIGDEEIVQRLVYALVNEGARLLEEGIASRASDIDLVYLSGYGFPAHRGGPLHFADEQGLAQVVQVMARFAANPHDDAAFWQPAPLLARLAAEGKRFSET